MHLLPSGLTEPSSGHPDRRADRAAEGGASRQREIINAFVDMSNELVEDRDVVDVLSQLVSRCAHLLDVVSAGLLIADGRGVLHLAAYSCERTHHLEILQLQRDEGPCLDCFTGGQAVLVPDLETEKHQWPQFRRAASEVGLRSVHALPMRLSGDVLGALGLFDDQPGALDKDDLDLAQALLHVATVAVVSDRPRTGRATASSLLQRALTSRIVVEQAKGVIAQAGDLEMEDAFAVLRRYARDRSTKLSVVASQIVGREVHYETLVQRACSAPERP